MFALIDIVWFAAGGALVWFYKDKLLATYLGAAKFAMLTEAKAKEAEAALQKAGVIK